MCLHGTQWVAHQGIALPQLAVWRPSGSCELSFQRASWRARAQGEMPRYFYQICHTMCMELHSIYHWIFVQGSTVRVCCVTQLLRQECRPRAIDCCSALCNTSSNPRTATHKSYITAKLPHECMFITHRARASHRSACRGWEHLGEALFQATDSQLLPHVHLRGSNLAQSRYLVCNLTCTTQHKPSILELFGFQSQLHPMTVSTALCVAALES